MAWATAEGKLTYHCSLDLRLMSWTLVGNPMTRLSGDPGGTARPGLSSYITRHQNTPRGVST